MISLQLRQQRLRRRPQLIAGAAQGHGEARVEHVAQLDKDDALLVGSTPRAPSRRGAAGVITDSGAAFFSQGHNSSPFAHVAYEQPRSHE
jgi:hypothetical protein